MWRSIPAFALAFLLAACASSGTTGIPRGRSDLLTEEQIRATNHSSAYDAVLSLRPNWLRTRGTDSIRNPGQVQVYLDNIRMGGVEQLRSLSTMGISYIQWFDGISAAARWGLDHGNGVIFVATAPESGPAR